MKKKAIKKVKLESIPKINRRLFKLWSEAVRERAGFACEYCGIKNKEINKNGVATKIDSHHLVSRDIKNLPLKFDIQNGIAVDPICHKWGNFSYHRNPVVTITWLQKNKPDRYNYVLENSAVRVDLENRMVLKEIEERLMAKESLDIPKLKEIELQFPKEPKKPKKIKPTINGSLFEEESSSSD